MSAASDAEVVPLLVRGSTSAHNTQDASNGRKRLDVDSVIGLCVLKLQLPPDKIKDEDLLQGDESSGSNRLTGVGLGVANKRLESAGRSAISMARDSVSSVGNRVPLLIPKGCTAESLDEQGLRKPNFFWTACCRGVLVLLNVGTYPIRLFWDSIWVRVTLVPT